VYDPDKWFFFRVVFQIEFFQFINFLIIFVVLGIAADDVFVFMVRRCRLNR
jgi:hypothetical protein